MRKILISLIVGLFAVHRVSANGGECRSPLGMESGEIPDHAISASSAHEIKSVGPQNARVRVEKSGGAWCPKNQISKAVREYLQIDLNGSHLITMTETQGRFGNGHGVEYTESYTVQYWRPSLSSWITYKNSNGTELLEGNKDPHNTVKQMLDLPFVASKVRFFPYSFHTRTVCMRVELYGCQVSHGIVSYSGPTADPQFPDLSYDGKKSDEWTEGGLGQLVDGVIGEQEYVYKKLLGHAYRGSQDAHPWVGWSIFDHRSVTLVFEFENIRKVKSLNVHTSTLELPGEKVFKSMEVSVSGNGIKYFDTDTVSVSPEQMKVTDGVLDVVMDFANRPKFAKFVKIQFFFSTKWILISEIRFETEVADVSSASLYMKQMMPLEKEVSGPTDLVVQQQDNGVAPRQQPAGNDNSTTGATSEDSSIFAIIWILGFVSLLALSAGYLITKRRQRKTPITINNRNFVYETDHIGAKLSLGDTLPSPANGKYNPTAGESLYQEPYSRIFSTFAKQCSRIGIHELNPTHKNPPYANYVNVSSSSGGKGAYSISLNNLPLLYESSSDCTVQSPPYHELTSMGKSVPRDIQNYYAATDLWVKTDRKEQNFTCNIFTTMKFGKENNWEAMGKVDSVMEFSRRSMRVTHKIGELQLLTLHVCETEAISGYDDKTGMLTTYKKKLVLIKSMRRGTRESIRSDVRHLCTILTTLRHKNICNILGICSVEDPISIVQEYTEFGSLATFLQAQFPPTLDETLDENTILYIIRQISAGMSYLENQSIVHRDLAARNCLMGQNYLLKISDHAMYADSFQSDYYKTDTGSSLPIRWMSWESLLLGEYSIPSDVWSFGITCWEILTLCRDKPFAELTDQQVIQNHHHIYQNNGHQAKNTLALPQPPINEGLYELVGACWMRDTLQRPNFVDIHRTIKKLKPSSP